MVEASRELLQANVIDAGRAGAPEWGGSRRTTRRMNPAARLWVYGRAGKPCRHCGTPSRVPEAGTRRAAHLLVPDVPACLLTRAPLACHTACPMLTSRTTSMSMRMPMGMGMRVGVVRAIDS